MELGTSLRSSLFATLVASALLLPIASSVIAKSEDSHGIKAVTTENVIEKARKNTNWKQALVTGKDAQVVFMSVSPSTNPANEIGMETHKFDQVIFVADGHAKAVINGVTSKVKSGDLIFVPQGVAHNFINTDAKKPFKIISVYSATDIPADTTYKKKSDAND